MLLGIDIGTTKAAAVIVDRRERLHASAAAGHEADLRSPAGRAEQDAAALLRSAEAAVGELPDHLLRQVQCVGVTGQMHGVVVLDAAAQPLTPLITWQDGRCLEDGFLDELNARVGGRLRTGYGCATLAWLGAHGELPPEAESSATIGDLMVARLCGGARPVTDPTHGASWGLFDLRKFTWDVSAVKAANLSPALLPEVVPCGAKAGTTCQAAAGKLGIPSGIPVAAAIGDNQASLLSTLTNPQKDLALTLGTGGQASAVLPAEWPIEHLRGESTYEYRPYPPQRMLIVASSLCGGAAWAWLAEAALSWMRDLGCSQISPADVFTRLNELAGRAAGNLNILPHFQGERHDTALRAAIRGIDLGNFDLGNVARSLARAIVANLKSMLPDRVLAGRERVVGSGNALRRNPALAAAAEEVFALPLKMTEVTEEAATGAALQARALL